MAAEEFDPLFTSYGAPVIVTQPQSITTPSTEFLSAYQPIVFDVTWAGDLTTDEISNKRVEAKVYYGNTPVLLTTDVKTSIDDNGTIKYRFNFSEMIKRKLNPEFWNNISTDTIQTGNENILVRMYIEFTALFRTAGNVERRDASKLTTADYYISNSILQPEDTLKVFAEGTSPYMVDSSTSKFLTKVPTNSPLYAGETAQLSFMSAKGVNMVYKFQTYDLAGSPNVAQTRASVDCTTYKHGTLTVTDNGANTVLNGFANLSKIDIWLENPSTTQITEKYTYLLNQTCNDGYRIWWVNSLGGVDKYTFEAYAEDRYELEERVNVQVPFNPTISPTDFSRKTIATTGRKRFTLTSDFLNNDYAEMFADLVNSTETYLQKDVSSNDLLSVNIVTESIVTFTNDGIRQVTFDIELSQKQITHVS